MSYRYERLSAQDNTFLLAETPTSGMHICGLQVLERGPLATASGGVDFALVRKGIEAVLHRIPRYRQKLQWTPVTNDPVWVDDPDFNLDYHMRHTSLPQPGSREQLKQVAARVMAQQPDRERPLWEMWVIEGLEDGRWAVVSKLHHCMIDGKAGVDLAQILLSTTPDVEIPEAPNFIPKPAPSGGELLRDEIARRAGLPLRALRSWRAFRRETDDVRVEIGVRLKALASLAGVSFEPASETPINGPLGPHRRFDWMSLPLADVKAVRRAAGCSVNDVVLTTATGAFRRYFLTRNVDPAELTFRASAPVSVRAEGDTSLGNKVSSWIVRLPLECETPREQMEAIHATTQEMKDSKQALGVDMMMQVAEWTPPVLLGLGARAASGPINTIITNVPGPQFPLYSLGCELLEMVPMAPLLDQMGLALALFSYNNKVFWGFNADYNLVPDLSLFVRFVQESFAELAEAYDVKIDTMPRVRPAIGEPAPAGH